MLATAKYVAIQYQTDFTFSFPYRSQDKILVYINGTKQNEADYTVSNGLVTLGFECQGGEEVVIKRYTEIDVRQVDFTDVSILREVDLDDALIQVFQKVQELQDRVDELEGV
jgi:hypothetical protein